MADGSTFRLMAEPIEPERLKRELLDDRAGALVCFEGWVRDHNEGQAVTALEYEAHPGVAAAEGERIIVEAKARFDIIAGYGAHRIGLLEIGDCAVWVGVCSEHRSAAFDACRYIIDELKHRVPIWKKEHYVGGLSGWINCAAVASRDDATPKSRS
jgi:molybdopterin synthase catalytic subunit